MNIVGHINFGDEVEYNGVTYVVLGGVPNEHDLYGVEVYLRELKNETSFRSVGAGELLKNSSASV